VLVTWLLPCALAAIVQRAAEPGWLSRVRGGAPPSDMLFSAGNNTRLERTGTRTLNSGIVMLSFQVPETGRGSAHAAGR
jgi:hypothetical protein